MGMSALLNEASALVATYREKNKVIDAALAAAVKAAPELYKIFYVDAVLGDDATGTGDKTKPFKTVSKACSTIPYGGGGIIYLADGQEFVLTADVKIAKKNIAIYPTPGYLVKPTLRNICLPAGTPGFSAGSSNMTTGFLVEGSVLVLRSLRIRTADYVEPAAPVMNVYTGFIRRNDNHCGTIHADMCDIELGDTRFMRNTINGQLAIVSLYSVKVTRVGPVVTNTPLFELDGTPLVLSVGGMTLPAGATWLNDLLQGVRLDANGLPRNVLTNIIL